MMIKINKNIIKKFRIFVLSNQYIWFCIYSLIPLVLFLLLFECKGGKLIFSLNSFNEFSKLMAQILGSFAAIIIAFFFVIFQMIESKKLTYFQSFRNELDKLKTKLLTIPSNISFIYQALSESIHYLDNIRYSDGIPARGEEQWNEITKPVKILIKKGQPYTAFNKKRNYYYDDLLSIYGRIEEYLSLLGVQAISIVASWTMLKSTVKLVITVFYFLTIFLIINLIADNGIHINSIILILFVFIGLYLSIIYISTVLIHIFDFYREYMSEIVEEEDIVS